MAPLRRIGLAVDTVGTYGREVIRGVMAFCHRRPDWRITVEPRVWGFDRWTSRADWDVDGLIVQAHSREFVEEVESTALPVVNVSNMCEEATRLTSIGPDDHAIGVLAAEHLLQIGFTHFGFCLDSRLVFGQVRLEAMRERVKRAGHTVEVCDTTEREIGEWLASVPKPIAILGCNDAWAHRVLTSAARAGINVPESVAVLGVDDDELLNTIVPQPLSSIAIPASKVGFEAAGLLDAMLSGKKVSPLTLLPPLCVVPRATTDALRVEDAHVGKAIEFIRAHYARPIQVNDVAEHAMVSRRSLERRMRQSLQRSVAGELMRIRLDRAKHLLSMTELSMKEVAVATGFRNPTRMGVAFRRVFGEAPSAFKGRMKCEG